MWKRLTAFLAGSDRLRNLVPEGIRRLGLRFVSWEDYRKAQWQAHNPLADAEEVSTYPAKVDVTLGILREFAEHHAGYIGACRDLGVPYRLLDLSAPDWMDRIQRHPCDAYLAWPSAMLTVWKHMFDERLRVMVQDLGKTIYPTYDELWMYESKRRMHYWLQAHGIAHPKTWVFYDEAEALAFARTAALPLVFKPDLGSVAKGVRIFRDRGALARHIRRALRSGVVLPGGDPRDRQWGSVLLQEYIPDAQEWRILRLGRSYFGHQKLKQGDFHSGSGLVGWYTPPVRLLDFARGLTDSAGFTSMDLDIFETSDGRYLVNELQSVFGSHLPYQMQVEGKPGRFLYDADTGEWRFEEGCFNYNASCTLRVEHVLEMLKGRRAGNRA